MFRAVAVGMARAGRVLVKAARHGKRSRRERQGACKSSDGGRCRCRVVCVVCLTGMLSVVKIDALARQHANAFGQAICRV